MNIEKLELGSGFVAYYLYRVPNFLVIVLFFLVTSNFCLIEEDLVLSFLLNNVSLFMHRALRDLM